MEEMDVESIEPNVSPTHQKCVFPSASGFQEFETVPVHPRYVFFSSAMLQIFLVPYHLCASGVEDTLVSGY